MKCLNCGNLVSDSQVCMTCGTDLTLYKKIVKLSNKYYNEGLEKARIRDLSGAIKSLNQSLRFYKDNTDARNLLGLIYYETGEVVSALSEWVVSKNFQSKKNAAGDYIKALQSNQGRLDTINQTIKKYNQALLYCKQGSEDLAIIQLKKVLSLNANLVKGHQLIALLYLKSEDYEKAESYLNKAITIDRTNTTTLRYLKEVSSNNGSKPSSEAQVRKKEKENRISYKSGNETIIQPSVHFKENWGLTAVINMIIGLVLGAALIWFLVVPARTQAILSDSNKEVIESNEKLASKTAEVSELQKKLETALNETEAVNKKLEEYTGATGLVKTYENLIKAAHAYIENDDVTAAETLAKIDNTAFSGDSKTLYDLLSADVNTKAASSLYTTGYSAYQSGNYEKAIEDLSKVTELDETNSNALYYLGRSYQKSGDIINANAAFDKVIELFPGTRNAANAQANKQ